MGKSPSRSSVDGMVLNRIITANGAGTSSKPWRRVRPAIHPGSEYNRSTGTDPVMHRPAHPAAGLLVEDSRDILLKMLTDEVHEDSLRLALS